MAKPENEQEIYGAPLDLPEASAEVPNHNPNPPVKRKSRLILITLIIIILCLISAGIYYFLLRPKDSSPTAQPSTSDSTTAEPKKSSSTTTELKKHTGDFPRMELSYPATWTLVEKDNSVTITSPEFDYKTSSKGVVKGNFSIYIRMGAREQEGKYIGRGVAIRPTEKLVYDAPSSTQRKDTNLTLFGLDTADHFSFFLISGDYVLQKGETLGPNYGREAETYIIAGGFGSSKQVDPLDYNNLKAEDATNDESYEQGIAIVKSLKVF